jgi:hypothetical protein
MRDNKLCAIDDELPRNVGAVAMHGHVHCCESVLLSNSIAITPPSEGGKKQGR